MLAFWKDVYSVVRSVGLKVASRDVPWVDLMDVSMAVCLAVRSVVCLVALLDEW